MNWIDSKHYLKILAIALVIFACYVVYIGIGKASTYVFNNFVLTLKTIGYIVLFLIALNLVICFIENVIKEANQKRSEDSSEDNVWG